MNSDDQGETIRSFLEDGWRVLVLKRDGDALELKEASLGPEDSIVQATPGVWARFGGEGGS